MQSGIYGNRGLRVSGGEGALLFDEKGKKYIDFFAGHGACLFGHAHPVLVSALKEASCKPWSTGAGMISEARDKASTALGDFLPGFRIYWANSGTEAVEAALKLCAINRPGRSRFLCLRRGFHGRSLGSLSLTFNPRYRGPFKPMLFEAEHLGIEELAGAIDEDTAAVFVEPLQGEGGVHVIPQDAGRAVTTRCTESGALLVADEIQTGFGRCGAFLGSTKTGLDPDIVCLSKGVAGGLPVGVTLWRESLADFAPMTHGSTTGGNALVCGVAHAAAGLLKDEDYPSRASSKGAFFRGLLEAIDSPLVKEVRGMGLLIGMELNGKSAPVVKTLQEKGLLALPAGPSVVRFLPPFTTSDDQFARAAEIVSEVIRSLEKRTRTA